MGARARARRVGRCLAAAVSLSALGIVLVIGTYGVPRLIANCRVAEPFVKLFNEVRRRAYFSPDPACLDRLRTSGLWFDAVLDGRPRDECPLQNVVRVHSGGVMERPLYMTCRLALSLRRFEDEVMQPAASRHFGQPVVRINELGVRNCRTVAGYRWLLSEHAFANAIDVSSFVLGDGAVVDVRTNWNETSERSAFLHEIASGACHVFRAVLGPGFDEDHADHLHFDMGLMKHCDP